MTGKISKNQLKHLRSLHLKKQRYLNNSFLVEGFANINEVLSSKLQIKHLYTTQKTYEDLQVSLLTKTIPYTVCAAEDLKKAGTYTTNISAIAEVEIPEIPKISINRSTLILDRISDPGNLGTLLRLCDWFGIDQLICSDGTADVYNPKVVSAAKGAFCRVNSYYYEPLEFLNQTKLPVFSAHMSGQSLHSLDHSGPFCLILGNEAHGLSEVYEKISTPLNITRKGNAESLNVAMAASIIVHWLSK